MSWIKAAGIRAIRTVAQTALALLSSSMLLSDVDWTIVVSASLLSGLLSILTSIAGLPEVEDVDVSFRVDKEKGEDDEN